MAVPSIRQLARFLVSLPEEFARLKASTAQLREALGRVEATLDASKGVGGNLSAHEFKVYSQWGEDGILQYLIRNVAISRRIFVEFGVEDYTEANTRFLLTKDNWSGLVIDGSSANIDRIRSDDLYWRHNLKAACSFVTRENINQLLQENGISGEIGLLSVDIDGNDYWVWEAISTVNPAIVVTEYNARFGPTQAVTVPYDAAFVRQRAHHSCIYYGASLAALVGLGKRKGYAFVGSNSAANNAFFVRRDLLPSHIPELTSEQGWRQCQFREARDASGKLLFLGFEEEAALLRDLPLVTVEP